MSSAHFELSVKFKLSRMAHFLFGVLFLRRYAVAAFLLVTCSGCTTVQPLGLIL